MINTPHNPLRHEPQAGSEHRPGAWLHHGRETTTTNATAPRERFVDPVHGRHCICARCLQQRVA